MPAMSLLRTLLLPLLLLAGGVAAAADCPPSAPDLRQLPMDELRAKARDRGVLWKLQKDGRTSWLYGTVHVGRPEWMVPGPRTVAALRGADLVALELDPADPELARVLTRPGDPARAQRVLDGLLARVQRQARRACLPEEQLAALRPMLQVVTLSMMQGRQEGLHPEYGMDIFLYGLARRLRKEVLALETPATQLAALQPESEADERVLIERSLEDMESGVAERQLDGLMQAWATGDADRLSRYREWCDCLKTPAEERFFRRLNDARNPGMADKLAAAHEGGRRVFAAVGALHMTGPKALQTLLRERGFTVERVPFPSPDRP